MMSPSCCMLSDHFSSMPSEDFAAIEKVAGDTQFHAITTYLEFELCNLVPFPTTGTFFQKGLTVAWSFAVDHEIISLPTGLLVSVDVEQ